MTFVCATSGMTQATHDVFGEYGYDIDLQFSTAARSNYHALVDSGLTTAIIGATAGVVGALIGGALTGFVTLHAEKKRHDHAMELETQKDRTSRRRSIGLLSERPANCEATLGRWRCRCRPPQQGRCGGLRNWTCVYLLPTTERPCSLFLAQANGSRFRPRSTFSRISSLAVMCFRLTKQSGRRSMGPCRSFARPSSR